MASSEEGAASGPAILRSAEAAAADPSSLALCSQAGLRLTGRLFQECEQLQKMYGAHMDERTLEKTQQQHILYQQEQHHQILQQQIQVGGL